MFGWKLFSVYLILFSLSSADEEIDDSVYVDADEEIADEEIDDSDSRVPFFDADLSDTSITPRHSYSLAAFGFFYLPKFHAQASLKLLQDQALNECLSRGVRRDVRRSVFGDQPDLENYLEDHARNKLGELRMTSVAKNDLSERMIELYESSSLLDFLKRVLLEANYDEVSYPNDLNTWNNIYLSNDEVSSVYLSIGKNGDKDEWHIDQHPFSCIHMLMKPESGGELRIAYKPPLSHHSEEKKFFWDWDFIEAIQKDDFQNVHYTTLNLKEGDVLCFHGNITLRSTNTIIGSTPRVALIMNYADFPNFKEKKMQEQQINLETEARHHEL